MVATVGQSLTLDPMGNTLKIFFLEMTTGMTVEVKHIHKCSLEGPLPKLCSWCQSEIQDCRKDGTKFSHPLCKQQKWVHLTCDRT